MKKKLIWTLGIVIGIAVAFLALIISMILDMWGLGIFYYTYTGPMMLGEDYSSLNRPTVLGFIFIFGSGILSAYIFINSQLKKLK